LADDNKSPNLKLVVADAEGALSQATKPAPKNKAKHEGHLEKLNSRFAVILNVGGQCLIADLAQGADDKAPMTLMSFTTFRQRYQNQYISVQSKDGTRNKQVGAWWLGQPGRRTYEGLVLEPTKSEEITFHDRKYLNLWQGWGVEPKSGDWSLMRRHIEEVLANGDPKAAEYIERYAAWCVQHPNEPAEVALVFRGLKGTGKGTFGNAMAKIFGRHGKRISDPKHLTGNFNAHLRDTILLFADEIRWSAKREDEGIMQTLITEPTIFIEQKQIDAYEWPNRLHIIMATNAEWAVPATGDERRYQVNEVSSKYAKGRSPEAEREAYFGPLRNELANGGLGAMLHDLLRMELGDWHPRRVYETEELRRQKQHSLKPIEEFYVTLLENGFIPKSEVGHPNVVLTKDLLAETQRQWSLRDLTATALGLFLREQGCIKYRQAGANGWQFRRLSEARVAWEKRFGGWPWHEPGLVEWVVDPALIIKALDEAAKGLR
jgi:hypothetical protein